MSPVAYAPVMICDHGAAGRVSFHADQEEAHRKNWHTTPAGFSDGGFPMKARIATREEHEAAGWDVSDYPRSITH